MSEPYVINKSRYSPIYISKTIGCINNFSYRDFKTTGINLCRYTCEENLKDLLNGTLKVFRRDIFDDSHERGEYNNPFKIYIDPAHTKRYNERCKWFKDRIQATKGFPAMCFTKWKGYDDYFFWTEFASKPTDICILFSLKNLARALEDNMVDFFMSKMTYIDISNSVDEDDILFSKMPKFKKELEYRIYLQNIDGSTIMCNDYFVVNINFELFDPLIIVSPFCEFETRKQELIRKYPILKKRIIKSKTNKVN